METANHVLRTLVGKLMVTAMVKPGATLIGFDGIRTNLILIARAIQIGQVVDWGSDMEEVTNLILGYREATRHLWNSYFQNVGDSCPSTGNLGRFEEIDKLLFISLVLECLEETGHDFDFRDSSFPFLLVSPQDGSTALKLRLSEPLNGRGRSWNDPITIKPTGMAVLELIELFDWNRYTWVSFPYYRVKVKSLPGHSQFEGLEALVEIQSTRIFYRRVK